MHWIGSGEVPLKEAGMTEGTFKLLEVLAEDNDYWKSALSFIRGIEGRLLSSLTDRQRDWVSDIIATLNVELNKSIAEELFDESSR